WFDVADINRGPARLDFAKLASVNAHYIRAADDARLVDLITPTLAALVGTPLDDLGRQRLVKGMPGLKTRAKTLVELAEGAAFYIRPRPLSPDTAAHKSLADGGREAIAAVLPALAAQTDWTAHGLETWARATAEARGQKLGQ